MRPRRRLALSGAHLLESPPRLLRLAGGVVDLVVPDVVGLLGHPVVLVVEPERSINAAHPTTAIACATKPPIY